MSTIKTTNITHGSNSGTANLVLADDGAVTLAKGLNTPMFLAGPAVGFTNGPSGTYKHIDFTEIYDPQGTYDASTSRFTPGVAGYYQFNASVKMGDPTGNDVYNFYLQVGKNSSGVAGSEEMIDNSDDVGKKIVDSLKLSGKAAFPQNAYPASKKWNSYTKVI